LLVKLLDVADNMVGGEDQYDGVFFFFQYFKDSKKNGRSSVATARLSYNFISRRDVKFLKVPCNFKEMVITAYDPDMSCLQNGRKPPDRILDKGIISDEINELFRVEFPGDRP